MPVVVEQQWLHRCMACVHVAAASSVLLPLLLDRPSLTDQAYHASHHPCKPVVIHPNHGESIVHHQQCPPTCLTGLAGTIRA